MGNFGFGPAAKAWMAGAAGAVATALVPLFTNGEPLDDSALWRAGVGGVLGYVAAWAIPNKPKSPPVAPRGL